MCCGYKFPGAPTIDLSPIRSAHHHLGNRIAVAPTSTGATIEDLPIFLDRAAATRPAASEETDPMPGAGLAFRQVA